MTRVRTRRPVTMHMPPQEASHTVRRMHMDIKRFERANVAPHVETPVSPLTPSRAPTMSCAMSRRQFVKTAGGAVAVGVALGSGLRLPGLALAHGAHQPI